MDLLGLQAARIHKGRVTLVSLENVNEELVRADFPSGNVVNPCKPNKYPMTILQFGGFVQPFSSEIGDGISFGLPCI